MAVHIIKLCVGAESIEDLQGWIAERLEQRRRQGQPAEQVHVTRMTPKRADEILAGGSLYWVIRGLVQCRQRLLDLRAVTGEDGITRCAFVLEPTIVPVEPRPRAPFQGWRYLKAEEAPLDLGDGSGDGGMPPEMRRELLELGLL
ncbi:DUF1489 family protein [Lutibaculum baratangense]|uniref:Uncharacterized conserved protein UCP032025 n=1 Tax=Lutibaculum baratangense AMV1 TaxID=631454 RepID=V4TAX2_9HYPH|nr:DUF1489 family protein [Lutibaculum baratangense]ESR23573.1 Uncharacterized conserved protein UCP032025 [Lutibaculum baratangense AMV1]